MSIQGIRTGFRRSAFSFFILLLFAVTTVSAQTGATDPAAIDPVETTAPLEEEGFGSLLLKTILNLSIIVGLVCIGAFGLKRYVGRRRVAGGSSVRVMSSTMLGPKKSLFIVSVEGKRLLLGVTEGSISVLSELGEEPAGNAPAPFQGKDAEAPHRFRDFMDSMMKRRGDDE